MKVCGSLVGDRFAQSPIAARGFPLRGGSSPPISGGRTSACRAHSYTTLWYSAAPGTAGTSSLNLSDASTSGSVRSKVPAGAYTAARSTSRSHGVSFGGLMDPCCSNGLRDA